MPENQLDSAAESPRDSAAWASLDDGTKQYVYILFSSGTACESQGNTRCGACVPCMANVFRKYPRDANGQLALSSVSYAQSGDLWRRVAAGWRFPAELPGGDPD